MRSVDAVDPSASGENARRTEDVDMNLGRFSVSLAVNDITASRAFYQRLGFHVHDDHEDEGWVIMRHGHVTIGLFQGMLDRNIMTFNPPNVHKVQAELKRNGMEIAREAEDAPGSTFLSLVDPDGNEILIDQYDPEYTPTQPV